MRDPSRWVSSWEVQVASISDGGRIVHSTIYQVRLIHLALRSSSLLFLPFFCVFSFPDDQYVPRSDHRARKVHYNGTLTGEDRKELSDLLQALTGTKESIKNATNWISQHCYYASDVVSTMDIEINSNISYEKKLFIFYVVNDTLGYW